MAAPPALKLPFRQRYISVSEPTYFEFDEVHLAFQACFDRLEQRFPGRWDIQTTHVMTKDMPAGFRVRVIVNALVRYQDEDELTPEEP